MKKKASKLIFISRIKRDGSGVEMINSDSQKNLEKSKFIDEDYKLNPLSLSEKTYIASGFNSYVVKLKKPPNK